MSRSGTRAPGAFRALRLAAGALLALACLGAAGPANAAALETARAAASLPQAAAAGGDPARLGTTETAATASASAGSTGKVAIYRMSNPATGDEVLTPSAATRKRLLKSRWRYEGIAFKAPAESPAAVYELVGARNGMHRYTASERIRDKLLASGIWNGGDAAFSASADRGVPVYQLYDPRSKSRRYVTGAHARQALVEGGCRFEKVAWRTSGTGKSVDWVSTLKVARKADQLIVVEANGTRAAVSMHEKRAGAWKRVTSTDDGWIGGSGLGRAREGIDYTPQGVMQPDRAFGIKPDPGCKMGYLEVDWSHYWCGDSYSTAYNMLVSTRDRTDFDMAASEHLASMGKVYDYCLNMGWNPTRTPHGGSAFFLHCSGGRPTGGCVSVPERTMVKILRAIRPGCLIVVSTPTKVMRY